MYLKYLEIVNYKNIKSSRFEFNKGANTIIGENDAGKSNALTALRILLDSSYYYNTKRLKETDFSKSLNNWKGHWIIITAFFDEISIQDKCCEVCGAIIPDTEDVDFLKSHIRCKDFDYGTVTLFIRPVKKIRMELASAKDNETFERIRNSISLDDYEFFYTSRSQADFLDLNTYSKIVGDLNSYNYISPENDDLSLLGTKIDILDVWRHISVVYIDALRDVEVEMKKAKNPLRRVFDVIQSDILEEDQNNIRNKINELNATISSIKEISNIGIKLNDKLSEIVGLTYSPNIHIESKLKEDIQSLARYLSVLPSDYEDIDLLGLGHLNILYIALKLVEFEYGRNHEIINIMIVEEPEAHIHTHIQKTLFENLNLSIDYTQVLMTTHSTHLSEVADINKINVISISSKPYISEVMRPTNQLDDFGKEKLELKDLQLSDCLKRYLDAKRSVLLFSKGIILVEGDGEEILIPAMVKKAFGISLDEIGIGLVNVGSVAFEYIASIFSDERLHRYCAILTDLDSFVEGSTKCSEEAAKRGISRKDKLDSLYGENSWVDSFYAPYTLEVDFANEIENRKYVENIVRNHYSRQATIDKHIENINTSFVNRYDSVLTVAKDMGKGWYATVLSSTLDNSLVIPDYILKALVFASQQVMTESILRKIGIYVLDMYDEDEKISELKKKFITEDINETIKDFSDKLPDVLLTKFFKYRMELM